MRGRKRIAGFVAAVAVSALLAPATASATPIPCSGGSPTAEGRGGMEVVSLRTFHIEAKVRKPVYRIGQTAVFDVHVTRPDSGDPLNAGVPMDGVPPQPAAEVNIGVGLLIGQVFLPGFAVTDENGDATIEVKIEKYVKLATVDAAFYAWKVVIDSPCARIEENGFRPYNALFSVKK